MPINLPAFDPLPNVGSQIERALAAYFISGGIGDVTNNHVTNDNTERRLPLNDMLAHASTEKVIDSRIEVYQVRISSEFPAVGQPDQNDTAWNWKQINDWIGRLMAVMSFRKDGDRDFKAVADLITAAGRSLAVDASNGADQVQVKSAADNADMANFTCEKVVFLGATRAGKTPEGALVFCEIRNFEIHAVPYNAD